MKADTVDLSVIFGKQVRYTVPLFQRPYVWTRDDQWEPLWQDVRAVADRQLDDVPSNDSIPHFLGAVVLEQSLVPTGMIDARSVIDGQQRLTTLQLLLAAARSVAAERGLNDSRLVFEKLLFNESFLVKHDGDQLKVLPTERDRAAFRDAVENGGTDGRSGHRIVEAYRYFRQEIADWATDGADELETAARIEKLSTVLWKRLVVVTIDLDPGDNAQMIFETLNARGTPLLAGDLIKNHLFQVATVQGADIDELYEKYWRTLDNDWWRQEVQQGRLKRPRLDAFLNHWLAMRTGAEVVTHDLFPSFKRYLADGGKAAQDVLIDIERYANVYATFESAPPRSYLEHFFYRLGIIEVTTSYPALLWLLGPEGITDEVERHVALGAIESWLVRRMLTRATTKNYNVVFLALLNAIRSRGDDAAPSGKNVIAFLAGLSGESQVWPDDRAFLAALQSLPLYAVLSRPRLRMTLEALEDGLRTEMTEAVAIPRDLTVEHVLPQAWKDHWPLPAGDDPLLAGAQREGAKHTLGNLTLLTGKLNPALSNGEWLAKRDAVRALSVLLISSDIRDAEVWDETSIIERGERLGRVALKIWPRPLGANDPLPDPGARVAGELPALTATQVADEAAAETLRAAGDRFPDDVRRLIQMRGSPAAARLAMHFAARALAVDGVSLRAQDSKGEPSYFQVRHADRPHVMAYVVPLLTGVRVEYRLPPTHSTYGEGWTRGKTYGIAILLSDANLDIADQLLKDALTVDV